MEDYDINKVKMAKRLEYFVRRKDTGVCDLTPMWVWENRFWFWSQLENAATGAEAMYNRDFITSGLYFGR